LRAPRLPGGDRSASGGGSARGMRARRAFWLFALATGCASSAGPGRPPPAPSATAPAPAPSAPADAPAEGERAAPELVAAMLKRVAVARQLAARAEVNARSLDRGALLGQVRRHVEKEVPPGVLRAQGEILMSLGLSPVSFDFTQGMFDL